MVLYRPLYDEMTVNAPSSASQTQSEVIALASGRFLVSWYDTSGSTQLQSRYQIKARLYEADGAPVGSEFVLLEPARAMAGQVSVIGLPRGGWLVTRSDDATATVIAQPFAENGSAAGAAVVVGTARTVVNATPVLLSPSATVLSSGEYVFNWLESSRPNQGGVPTMTGRSSLFDAEWRAVGGTVSLTPSFQDYASGESVVALGGSNFVLGWLQGGDFMVRVWRAGVSAVSAPIRVSPDSDPGNASEPRLVALGNGGFVAVYITFTTFGSILAINGLRAQLYTATGTPVGGQIVIDANGPAQVVSYDVTALAEGGFAVAWAARAGDGSGTAIVSQRFSDAGTALAPAEVVNTVTAADQIQPNITALAIGGYAVSWSDPQGYTGSAVNGHLEVRVRTYLTGQVGTVGNDVLVGTDDADTLYGGAGNDSLDGRGGADTMVGGQGDDTYVVDDGGDVVREAAGGGYDTVRTALTSYVLPDNVEALVFTGVSSQRLAGNAGDNSLTGAEGRDYFDLSQGGDDRAMGGGDADAFFMGAALTGADRIDGGTGFDEVGLQGNYTGAGALVLQAGTLVNVEALALLAGGSYTVTSADGTVAAGQVFTVSGNNLGAGDSFTFNGAAETDGSFLMYGGLGVDNLTGGARSDAFYFGPDKFGVNDVVVGGTGIDELGLDGLARALTLTSANADVEAVALLRGPTGAPNSFGTIIVDDSWVAAGQTKTITAITSFQGRTGPVTTDLVIDGSRESNGNLRLLAGSGNDRLSGGAGNDTLFGGLGADTLVGGAGADVFVYNGAEDSTGRGFDRIDLGSGDRIDLATAVTATRADVVGGRLSDASFDADLAAVVGSGRLGANQALLFRPDAGEFAGKVFLVVDANGVGGYQAGSDYLIELTAPSPSLDVAIFI